MPNFKIKPVIGQEAVVPEYGLGRVISFRDKEPARYIEVKPYICGYPMIFDPKNVKLIKIFFEKQDIHIISQYKQSNMEFNLCKKDNYFSDNKTKASTSSIL